MHGCEADVAHCTAGCPPFFCDDGPRRLTPSPYGGNALSESGDPGITALCDAALAAVSL